jgi:hypothetical protein
MEKGISGARLSVLAFSITASEYERGSLRAVAMRVDVVGEV